MKGTRRKLSGLPEAIGMEGLLDGRFLELPGDIGISEWKILRVEGFVQSQARCSARFSLSY